MKSGGKPAKKLKTGAEAEHALVEKAAIIATIFGLCVTRQISKCTSQVMLTNKLKNSTEAQKWLRLRYRMPRAGSMGYAPSIHEQGHAVFWSVIFHATENRMCKCTTVTKRAQTC